MTRVGLYLLLATAQALLTSPARADASDVALAKARNCLSCHALERKLVGPAYQDVAARYQGDKAAPARLTRKVMEGGGGVWGVLKMPSNPQLSEAEAKKLVAWVLSQQAGRPAATQ